MELRFGFVEHAVVAGSEIVMKELEVSVVRVYVWIVGESGNG